MMRCKYCGREAPGPVCPACAELDGSPSAATSPHVLRYLAAGYVLPLESIGRDFRPSSCLRCGSPGYSVDGDPHRLVFHFGLSGVYQHQCGKGEPPGDHPRLVEQDRLESQAQQWAEQSMYVTWGRS